eukprot:9877358-Alexandrium_andersonii.AAC.1
MRSLLISVSSARHTAPATRSTLPSLPMTARISPRSWKPSRTSSPTPAFQTEHSASVQALAGLRRPQQPQGCDLL